MFVAHSALVPSQPLVLGIAWTSFEHRLITTMRGLRSSLSKFSRSTYSFPCVSLLKLSRLICRNAEGGSITPPIPGSTTTKGSGGGPTSSSTQKGAAFATSAPLISGSAVAALSTVVVAAVSAALWMF